MPVILRIRYLPLCYPIRTNAQIHQIERISVEGPRFLV